ncbi:MAG: hypothetical protein ACE37N_04595 [Pseudohongiellaceae bacterium]
MTIVAGFSILALSNFIPTIVFGLLTSLAMLVALTGSLTLLPASIIQPLGGVHGVRIFPPGGGELNNRSY